MSAALTGLLLDRPATSNLPPLVIFSLMVSSCCKGVVFFWFVFFFLAVIQNFLN